MTQDWTSLPPPRPALAVCVIVPVRNEARRLPAALRALAAQTNADGSRFDAARFEVIVLANNCTDTSAEIVRRFAARHPRLAVHVVEAEFSPQLAHVGHARRCLMDEASRRLERTAGDAGVIASTDGDTKVARDWLAATLAEMAKGADAVGGRIIGRGDVRVPDGIARLIRRDETYQRLRVRLEHALDEQAADPWPRHHQHFGASLGLTVGAYRQIGGLPEARFLEDEALVRELCRHDLRVRHSPRVVVTTSSRRSGRVEVGLSWQLREWAKAAAAGGDAQVGDPREWAAALALRGRLRRRWQARAAPARYGAEPVARGTATATKPIARVASITPGDARLLDATAARLDVPPVWLARTWARAPTFGAFWAEVEARRDVSARRGKSAPPTVPMREAIAVLRELLVRQARVPSRGRGRLTKRSSR